MSDLIIPGKTYGTLHYEPHHKKWIVEAEPHVLIRFKRVFANSDASERKRLILSASPGNSRDLEWFLERYPLTVDQPERLHDLACNHIESETILHRLLSGVTPPKNFTMKVPLRQYQALATQMWLVVHGYLLGDAVGLGKTAVALGGMVEPGMLPSLVVTMTHLTRQWAAQVEMFTGLETHILRKATPYDITKYHNGHFPDVVICNYHKLSGWRETFDGLFKSVAFDEVHELRHTGSAKYAAAKDIAAGAECVIGLSATPIFNYGGEIFNIMEILRPGALGTSAEFEREWCKREYQKVMLRDPVGFGSYLRESGLMLRRTRKEVGRELPPVTIVPHIIEADLDTFNKMKGASIDLAKIILQNNEEFKGQKLRAAGEFDVRLRQATGVAKAPFVAEFVKMLHEETGEKIVLFGWHHEVYRIWMEKLKDLNPVMYTGTESATQKDQAKEAFVHGPAQVMIISNRSGLGLDGLQEVCHLVVVGELDPCPAVHVQNIGRVDRDGQQEPTMAYFLIADSGSDPVISSILGVKKQQLEGLNDPNPDQVDVTQVDPGYIKKLAHDFLIKSGEPIPAQPEDVEECAA